MIRPNIDRRVETARLQRAALQGKGGPAPAADPAGTTLLNCGVVPHSLDVERDGQSQSVWAKARGTRPLAGSGPRTQPLGSLRGVTSPGQGGGPARDQTQGQGLPQGGQAPARTELLPLGRLSRWLWVG